MKRILLAILIIGVVGCADPETEVTDGELESSVEEIDEDTPEMNELGSEFVELVLALGEHDDGYVDAYYGPDALKEKVEEESPTLDDVESRARDLVTALEAAPGGPRRDFLLAQTNALVTRVEMLGGAELSFDDESAALYGAKAPINDESHFNELIASLDSLLPGEGEVQQRFETFRKDFIVPPEKLDAVFSRAIEGCRERTEEWIDLPESESFTVEYVKDKPWSGYNWYQGGYESLIQVNTDFPIYIERAIDLACHEGYPGHHVYNLLRERKLGQENGWVEHTIYPLYSPLSLIAEGSANYGIEMAFPEEEKVEFEKRELYPLAGIDPAKAEQYEEVRGIVARLNYAGNEAARRYLDGEITREEAADWLVKYSLSQRDRALQRTRFYDTYGAYVINYNLGKDIVRRWVELKGGDSEEERWDAFETLLSSPLLPQDLLADLGE